jgi:hypothetical protein
MNVTLSLDDDLVNEVHKIAVERDTTLAALVQNYLEKLAIEHAGSDRKQRDRETLDGTFDRFRLKIGGRSWTRADLHARS